MQSLQWLETPHKTGSESRSCLHTDNEQEMSFFLYFDIAALCISCISFDFTLYTCYNSSVFEILLNTS